MVESGLKLQDQMIAAYTELAGLRQVYSEDNVRVRAARARIAELQFQIDKAMGSTEDPGLDANHSAYPSFSELPALGLTYYDLDRKMRVEELLWETLTKQYEAAKVQEAKEIPTVRVLDAANVPQRKSSAARRFIMVLGTMLSLFVACISVFIMNTWEEMDPQDERKMLVTEIGNATLSFLKRIRHLPGIRWIMRASRDQSSFGS
jgi:capsule polysaccharide export protein KpsE/RkpR